MQAVDVSSINDLSNDFSAISLILNSHWVVQAVVILLIVFSVASWAIIFYKMYVFANERRKFLKFEDNFWGDANMKDLYNSIGSNPSSSIESVFVAGMGEWKRSLDHLEQKGSDYSASSNSIIVEAFKERFNRVMNVVIARQENKFAYSIDFLATVGAVSPFIGLFGTVWGVKTSFQDIAASQSTSLAIVAPGIAEALVATAVGLMAAIPAVVAYNVFNKSIERLVGSLEIFSDEFFIILSRRMERAF